MIQPTTVVDVRNASKRYLNVTALSRVDFSVGAGEVRALLGKNGAGKSTLIRLISGAEQPDTGEVRLDGTVLGSAGVDGARRLGVSTVYQELSLIGSMTVAENMFMGRWLRGARGIDYGAMAEQSKLGLERLGLRLDPNATLGDLGIADQQMIEIARALIGDPKVLILDEPTSSLAADEVTRVLDVVSQISSDGVAVIYVSHRLGEIRRIASTASVMRDGQLVDTAGVAELSTGQVVSMMLGDTVDELQPLDVPPDPNSEVAVSIRDLVWEPKLNGVNLELRKGEVLGIAGVLGSGRTELLEVISGISSPDSGSVTIDGRDLVGRGHEFALRAGVGLTPENRKEDGIFPELSIAENIVVSDWKPVSRLGVLRMRAIQDTAKRLMKNMSVKASSPDDEIGTLSGGNQQKVVIARWLHAKSSVLLLDEPTRGVDIEAKAQIYALMRELAAAGTSIVFVSSEIEELQAVCDRAVVLRAGQIMDEFHVPDIRTETLLAAAIADR